MPPRIAIVGYASLDHVAMLDGSPRAGRTTTMLERKAEAWPRLGGSPSYVAAALAAGGVDGAFPVTWIGDDAGGRTYLDRLQGLGVPVDGVAIMPGERTPAAVLAYEPGGGCICLYDPGLSRPGELSDRQRVLIAGADWLCLTVGPARSTEAALAAIGGGKVAWVVKDDPRALSRELAARLAARADLICYSQAEKDFVAAALGADVQRAGQVRIETRGGDGATFMDAERTVFVPAEPLAVTDPTGAGDTFAGGALAALAGGETDPAAILRAGHRAAHTILKTRLTIGEHA